jgi:hypothetical protein
MRRSGYCYLLILILAVALAGCSGQNDPLLPDNATGDDVLAPRYAGGSAATLGIPSSVVLNGYLVEFDGRTVAGGKTTFSYTVTGQGADHALSHFLLEIPDCAPPVDSYTPAGATIGIDPHTDLYTIKWNLSLGTNESRSYSYTFPGDVPPGIVFVDVKASTVVAVGEIVGPCKGFEISGTVYADTDGDGTFNIVSESGIKNVTVAIDDGVGNVETMITDANGYYRFFKPAGTYTVRIDAATPAEDFNEQLGSSFDASSPTALPVTIGPDSPGNNFGFDPKTEEITMDIVAGLLLTDGESVRYWRKELSAANKGGKGFSNYDLATMTAFIAEIQAFYLPDPFQFTPGSEFQEALDIVLSKSEIQLDILRRELLMAELNEVSGKGLVDVPGLQTILLRWVESVYDEAASAPALQSPGRPVLGGPIDDRVANSIDLLIQLNGSSAGGSGGGG